MTATHGEGAYGNAVGVTTPTEHKMAQVSEFVKTGVNTIRAGLLWDGNATVVSGKANMSVDVRAFSIVTQRSATSGVMKWTNDATLNLTKDVTGTNLVAPGSNSVYWNVFAWHREYSLDGTNSDPVIAVLIGTAAASPSVPALTAYTGAISLATVLVPAGTTATNSGTTITQTAPFTASAGGVVVVRNTTERDAGTWAADQVICLLDTGAVQQYSGGLWPTVGAPGWGGRVVRTGTTGSFTGAAWTVLNSASVWTVDQAAVGFATFATSGLWTVPAGAAGVYDVEAQIQMDTAVNAWLAIKRNSTTADGTGSVAGQTGVGVAGTTIVNCRARVRLAAGDTITAAIFVSATAKWSDTTLAGSFLGIRYVEPLR